MAEQLALTFCLFSCIMNAALFSVMITLYYSKGKESMKRTVCFILSCLLLLSVCKGLPVRAQEALLSVYVQYGTQTECIAAYSASELAELAETSEEGYGYYFYKNM